MAARPETARRVAPRGAAETEPPLPGGWRLPRPATNLGRPERVLRAVAGVLLAAGGAFALPGRVDGAAGAALWVLVVVTVVDLVVSGAAGYCPLHRFLSAAWTRGAEGVTGPTPRGAAVGAWLVVLLAALGLAVLVVVVVT